MQISSAVASSSLRHKLTAVFVSMLVLSAIAFFKAPLAFGQGENISNTSNDSRSAQIAVGDYIYVVWQDGPTSTGGDIYFAFSADDFVTSYDLSDDNANTGVSSTPQIAANGNNAYVVWRDATTGSGDIYFAKITIDDEALISSTADPIEATAGSSSIPQIAVAGDNVYVVWRDDTEGNGEIYFKASTDGGDTFGSKLNLSSSSGTSTNPQVAAVGDNVYVVWQDATTGSGDTYFIASNDDGSTFNTRQTLSPAGSTASTVPQIAAVDDNVYVVWQENVGNNEIYFANSFDDGASFAAGVDISSNDGSSTIPQISAIDNFVYVAWKDNTGLTSGSTDIFFKRSSDNGDNFDAVEKNLSNTADRSSDAEQITLSGNNVFVTWEDNFLSPSNFEILLAVSIDNGESFTDAINLSETDNTSRRPQIASMDDALHAVWDDSISGSNIDIFVYTNVDYLSESITVDLVNNTNPKWEVDTVLATGGTVNADPGDTVTIEWGTGETSSPDITIEEDGSWTATHEYSMSAVSNNPHQIIAKIIDATTGDPEATSDPYPDDINVASHDTVLELERIGSVVEGSGDQITIAGTLTDNADEAGISGQTITFSGAGATLFPADPIVTEADGTFTFTSDVQAEVANDLDVQAHFAGTDEYSSSDSNIETYDVLDSSVVPFDVTAGEDVTIDLNDPSVPIDFNASITFDHLLTSGTVFVQECDAPSSDRYESLENRCLEISLDAQMELDSLAHVQIEFEENQIPDAYSTNDVEIFHEVTDGGAIVDITESKDMDELTVTGTTGSFSRFILGAAIHEDKPEGAIRQPIYLGQDNVVTFRNIDNPNTSTSTISLDKSEYDVGDTAILTIEDEDANLDINAVDSITALVASETSYPDAITIELTETGIDTGMFIGSFNLVSGSSSGDNLQASSGDGISVTYDPWVPSGRFKATIEGLEEAGLAQLKENVEDFDDEGDYALTIVTPLITPVELEFVDASIGEDADITVTMSYVNAYFSDGFIHGAHEEFLKMYYKDPTVGDWIDVTIDDSLDTTDKTLKGHATAPGIFLIGFEGAAPGGAGGGLGKPGTGVVLDFIASVSTHSSSSGGHHHGGNGISTEGGSGGGIATTCTRGCNVQIDAVVQGMTDTSLTITFETLIQTGDIVVTNQDITELTSTFSSVQDGKGTTSIDGSDYTTTGPLYDVNTSALEYSGFIEVTVPYNESRASQLGSESDVRLLHYNGSKWQDVTTNIDTEGNTVSGKITSTSPLAVAIVSDGTFNSEYFIANPLDKVMVNAELVVKPVLNTGDQTLISPTIKNTQRTDQAYTFIVQIISEDGITQNISMSNGVLGAGDETKPSIVWIPEQKGNYTIQMFVWDGLDSPSPLSDIAVKSFSLS